MKKSFKWLLCASLVFSSTLAAACGEVEEPEAHEHTWATTYSSDANGHWYAATCEHTDQKMSLALHTDEDNDGVCDTCAYDTHQGAGHSYATEWTYDTTNHWHAVSCGHVAEIKDKAAHVDEDDDGVCDICEGNTFAENHEHVYASEYEADLTYHWNMGACEGEGDELCHTGVIGNKEKHDDDNEDGICDVCKNKTYADTHTHAAASAAEYKYDATNHWKVCADHNGVKVDITAHVDKNNDKVCDTCSYDYNHTHRYNTSVWSGDATNHWHAVTCGCTIEVVDKAAHVDENKDGVCDVCGKNTFASTHEHSFDGAQWQKDGIYHWKNATCEHTGVVGSKAQHTGLTVDGICDVCGWFDASHEHTYATEWSKNETKHWRASNCGHTGFKTDEADHQMVNGECTTCGYDGDHEHTYATEWVSDETNHWLAANCGCTLKVAVSAHDGMDDAVCDTCGWYDETHTCAPTEGVWGYNEEGHAQYCPDHTSVWFNADTHEDNDEDGVCDVCTYVLYAAEHVHADNATTSWVYDSENHWNVCADHAGIVLNEAAHVDDGSLADTIANDGVCDVCGYVYHDHTLSLDSAASDETKHVYVCDSHSGYVVEGEHEGMTDGVCDVCAYVDFDDTHTHTYEEEYSSDFNAHWKELTCSHTALIEKEAHVDEDANGACDDCGHEMFGNVIEKVTNETVKGKVVSGMYFSNGDPVFYEYGQDYFHYVDVNYQWEHWYTLQSGNLIALEDTGFGLQKAYVDSEQGNKYIEGKEVRLSWDWDATYGVENSIAYYWSLATSANAYNLTIENEDATYVFSFDYYIYGLYRIQVEFTTETSGDYVYARNASFAVGQYGYDEYETQYDDDWNVIGVTINSAFNGEFNEIVEFAGQRFGTRTAACPFDVSELIPSSYDLTMYALTYEDWMWNEAAEASTFATDLTIELENGYRFYFGNVAPSTANLTFDALTYTINGAEYADGIQINSYLEEGYFEILVDSSCAAGSYTMVVSTTNVTTTFNVTVTQPAVTEISAAQYSNVFYEMMPISEINVFVGETAKFYSMVNKKANNAYTAAVTSENAATATLTAGEEDYFGIPYTFSATAAGTYTVVLTSVENDEITGTLTINVAELPGADELLSGYKGYYAYDDWLGAEYGVGVLFTPTEEGATSGTAVIDLFDLDDPYSWSPSIIYTTETVSYVYDEENGITLTHVEGTDLITERYLELYIENGRLYVGMEFYASYDMPFELTDWTRPEIPSVGGDEEEPVVGGTFAGTYTATDDWGNSLEVVITDTTITFTHPRYGETVWEYTLDGDTISLSQGGTPINNMTGMQGIAAENGVATTLWINGTEFTLTKKVEFAGTYTATDDWGNSLQVVITDTTITFTPPRSPQIVWEYTLDGDTISLSQGGTPINNMTGIQGIAAEGGVATTLWWNGTEYTMTK